MDTTTLVAALLHDTVEDTSYTLPRLHQEFGPEVSLLVDGVTKFDKGFFGADAEVETIRKMLVKAGQDVRVLVIKLADRLHNMRTIQARSPASRARIAHATRDVLVPLCDRLGIQALKRELEDTVLWALDPDAYEGVRAHVASRPNWASFLSDVIGTIQPELARAKIDARVTPRPRHYYSIWKDARDKQRPREVPRIVVIVEGPMTDCYAALGTVHSTWRPVPGRFKDFIASPKNNLYRSLHTTVLGPERQPLEVLIRTEPMHRAAEYGIVSNFRFPEHTARLSKQTKSEQLDWLRRVLDWQVVADDAERFLDALRCDLTENQIHVFTGDGRRVQWISGTAAWRPSAAAG
jgi:GTP pyrophosphokinase